MDRVERPQSESEPMGVEGVEADAPPCSSITRTSLSAGPPPAGKHIEFIAEISCDGCISLTTEDPADYADARELFMRIARACSGDGLVVETRCKTPEQAEAIAQRLAKVILQGLVR
jgi:hypothetical protein